MSGGGVPVVALVTGASRGIGRAVALRLGAAGVRVIVHYRARRDDAEAVARAAGSGSFAVGADLGTLDGVEAVMAQLGAQRVDILVNNAGVWKPSPLGATTRERLDELVDVNLKAPFWLMQCALPILNNGARVVNVSSVAARTGIAGGRSVYGATKAALEAFTRNWAMELAPRRIRVNAVAPGYVETDMTAAHLSDAATRQRAVDRHPLGRLGVPEDTAAAVEFLCSPAAEFITGQVLNVSGGFVI